MHSKYLIFSG